jgi:hypothetical protein
VPEYPPKQQSDRKVELFILENWKSKRAERLDSDFTTFLNANSVDVEGRKMVASLLP